MRDFAMCIGPTDTFKYNTCNNNKIFVFVLQITS